MNGLFNRLVPILSALIGGCCIIFVMVGFCFFLLWMLWMGFDMAVCATRAICEVR